MTIARVLALMLLIATSAVAQNLSRNSVEENGERIGADGGAALSTVPVAPSATPVPQRVIDKKFIAVMGALGGAESLRFTSRKLVLDNEYAAGAPWVTHVPANQQIITRDSGFFAAELLVTYELKKRHSWLPGDKVIRKLWWAYPATMAVIHVKNGIGNIRTQGPGGCTSVQCAMQAQ